MTVPAPLDGLVWPEDRLAEALAAAVRGAAVQALYGGGAPPSLTAKTAASAACDDLAAERVPLDDLAAAERVPLDDLTAAAAGLEADEVEIAWGDLERVLPRLAPAVLRHPAIPGLLVLPRGRGRRVILLAPDGRHRRLSAARLAHALRRPAEGRLAASVEPLLVGLSLSLRRRRRASRGLLAAHLAATPGCTGYLVALAAGGPAAWPLAAPFGSRALVPLLSLALALFAAVAAGQALYLGSWCLLGRVLVTGQSHGPGGSQGPSEGRLDRGSLLAWALLLLTLPLGRFAELAAAAALGHRAVLLLRRRLAAALLALAPASLRGEGTGRLLGRLLAAESLERLLLAAGPAVPLAVAELAGAAAVLAQGAAAAAHLALLLAALLAAAALAWRHARAQRFSAACRLALTGDLVEALSGHRTRLAQRGAAPEPLDDVRFAACHAASRRMDGAAALLRSVLPRAWLLAGLALLVPALDPAGPAPGAAAAPTLALTPALAASLGGLLLAQAGLARLAAILCDLAAARTAFGDLRPLLAGTAFTDPPALLTALTAPRPRQAAPRLVEARDLSYRPPGRPRPILAGAALTLRRGDRLLLDGASGSGKSTLAALLAGELPADSGLLLLDGLDLAATGIRAWRRRVVTVPQLHANHLFADTLAFNLLLGRGWPPSARDLGRAAGLCRDLGLGDLLDRLPAGLEQRIGEAGWQLSDGEASRVCLARALLQDPDLLILDESLAALDPENRLLALDVAAKRARTLVLIAHATPG